MNELKEAVVTNKLLEILKRDKEMVVAIQRVIDEHPNDNKFYFIPESLFKKNIHQHITGTQGKCIICGEK